jgi:PST family polysaccharide transporter
MSDAETLERTAGRSTRWSAVAQIVRNFSQIGFQLLLVFFMAPEQYGVVALLATVTLFMAIFRGLGFNTLVIIQNDDVDAGDPKAERERWSALFWANLLVCGMVGLSVAGASVWLAEFFAMPDLRWAAVALGCIFWVQCTGLVHMAILERHFEFRTIAMLETGGCLVAAMVGVGFLYNFDGLTAFLAFQAVIGGGGSLAGIVAAKWWPVAPHPRLINRIDRGFSGSLLFFNLFNFLARNIDKLLIGRLQGAADLGVYGMASRLMTLPSQLISNAIDRVALPTYARQTERPEELARSILLVHQNVTILSIPIMGFAFVGIVDGLQVMGLDDWTDLGVLVRILAPIGVFHALGALTGSVLMVTRRTRLLRGLGIYNTVVYTGLILAGLPWGLIGVTISYGVGFLLLVFAPTLWMLLRPMGITPGRYLKALVPILAAGALAVMSAEALVPMIGLELGWMRLGASFCVFSIAYLSFAVLLAPRVVRRIATLDFFDANRPVGDGS